MFVVRLVVFVVSALARDSGNRRVEDAQRGVGLGRGQHQRRATGGSSSGRRRGRADRAGSIRGRRRRVRWWRAPWSDDRAPARCRSSARARARRRSARCFSISALAPAMQMRADDLGVLHQRLAQQPDRRQRRGARHGIAAERAGVRPGRPRDHLRPRGGHAERQPRRNPLRHRHDVGLRRRRARSRTSGRCGPCPDCTSSTTSSMPCVRRDLAQPLQEDVGRHDVAALALDRLDDDRRDFVGRDEVDEQLLLDESQALRRARRPARGRPDSDSSWRTARGRCRARTARTRAAA